MNMPDGRDVKRLEELHPRCYRSIFGEFQLQRAVYGTREGQIIDFAPLDVRLQLPESEFSYVLQDWAQALGVEHAFARTAEVLRMILGLNLPVDSFCQAEEDVFSWMADEVGTRRRRGQKIVCLMDGQPSLWAVRKTFLPGDNVVEILDLFHVNHRATSRLYNPIDQGASHSRRCDIRNWGFDRYSPGT